MRESVESDGKREEFFQLPGVLGNIDFEHLEVGNTVFAFPHLATLKQKAKFMTLGTARAYDREHGKDYRVTLQNIAEYVERGKHWLEEAQKRNGAQLEEAVKFAHNEFDTAERITLDFLERYNEV